MLLPLPAQRPYSYLVPDGATVAPGSVVRVPLGPRLVSGVVWDTATDPVDARKLKGIDHVFDCPPLTEDMRRFVDWVSDYTLSPPGLVARMVLRVPDAFDPEPARTGASADRDPAGADDRGAPPGDRTG